MKEAKKGLENIRTLRSMVNNSMTRTSRGALMERARLSLEWDRLLSEVDRLNRRMAVIGNRLEEIAKLERWLERFAEARQSPSGGKGNGSAEDTKKKRGAREMILKY